MENIELYRIESGSKTMPGGIGGMFRYTVDEISHAQYIDNLDDLSVKLALQMEFNMLAGQGMEQGEYLSSFIVPEDDGAFTRIIIAGTFMLVPDYRLLRRIVRWKYNYNSDEAVSLDDFREAYGPAFGEHFYAKWLMLDRDIIQMIAYFADDIDKGQEFIAMVMKRVYQYEKRTKAPK